MWCFSCFWTTKNMFCLLIHVRKRFWKSLAPGRPSSLGLANKGSVSSKEWKFFMFPIFTTLSNFNVVFFQKKENINKHPHLKYNFGKIEKKRGLSILKLIFRQNIKKQIKKKRNLLIIFVLFLPNLFINSSVSFLVQHPLTKKS